MTTQAQLDANRLNAQKSTGPRTPEGRSRSAQNALKHGLLARQILLPCEDPDDFEALRRDLFETLAPDGPFQTLLVERILTQHWRLRRAVRVETVLLNNFYENFEEDDQYKKDGPVDPLTDPDRTLGLAIAEDMATETCLLRMQQYESRIESGLYKALRQLHLLRSQKKKQAQSHHNPAPCHPESPSCHPERSEGSGPATMNTNTLNEPNPKTEKIRRLTTNDDPLTTNPPNESNFSSEPSSPPDDGSPNPPLSPNNQSNNEPNPVRHAGLDPASSPCHPVPAPCHPEQSEGSGTATENPNPQAPVSPAPKDKDKYMSILQYSNIVAPGPQPFAPRPAPNKPNWVPEEPCHSRDLSAIASATADGTSPDSATMKTTAPNESNPDSAPSPCHSREGGNPDPATETREPEIDKPQAPVPPAPKDKDKYMSILQYSNIVIPGPQPFAPRPLPNKPNSSSGTASPPDDDNPNPPLCLIINHQ